MYTEDKPNLRVRLRRWWKNYKDEIRWNGYITPLLEDFMPGYYRLYRLYWAIRHRTTDVYHKVDTKLPPEYYDVEILMLHSCFALLERYVEDEMGGVAKCEKNIADLESNWGQPPQFDDPEFVAGDLKGRTDQAAGVREALRLYKWWKEDYPKIDENNPHSKWFDKEYKKGEKGFDFFGRSKPIKFDEDGDPTLYELVPKERTPEEEAEHTQVTKDSMQYEIDKMKEVDDNFIALIKLRRSLWT